MKKRYWTLGIAKKLFMKRGYLKFNLVLRTAKVKFKTDLKSNFNYRFSAQQVTISGMSIKTFQGNFEKTSKL
jgi:hypothetical protein